MHPSIRVAPSPIIALSLVCLLTIPALAEDDPPFEITEDRPRCDHYDGNKQPFFGTTHLHTGLSFDASIRFVDYHSGNNPRGAYAFARGEKRIQLPDPTGRQLGAADPLRYPKNDRPTDWGAVTDHSEHFGEMGICKNLIGKEVPERLSMECRMINGFFYEPGHAPNPQLGRTLASNAFTNLTITSLGSISRNTHLPVCENNRPLCEKSEMAVWDEVRLAAHDYYDQSPACEFTTFIAYENTSTPLLNNWHRNVIFRNDKVVKKPVTSIDMAVVPNTSPTRGGKNGVGEGVVTLVAEVEPDSPDAERISPAPPGTYTHPLPQPFWKKLERDCTEGFNVTDGKATRCDFITIPHNSNLGGGSGTIPPMFLTPYNTEDAKLHAKMEPLVEIYQDKGSSECRYDPRFLSGTDTIDEFCAFEILDGKTLGSASGVGSNDDTGPAPPDTWGPRSYVRNVWKDGIEYAADNTFDGVNPFKMGVVASSDSHTGVMGWHPEDKWWPGHLGIDDAYPTARPETIQNSSGGHSVVWAEENSRDSIFEALKRKETYGTSGTRIVARFFGGWDFPFDACEGDFVSLGYAEGVPMGRDLRKKTGEAPRFVAAAWRDFTNLQQIQIVKGWVDDDGNAQERVYRVKGDPGAALNPQANLDSSTCRPKDDIGYEGLCAVWEDPDFDPDQHAFYYLRVLEEPVCRYSTLWCRERICVDGDDGKICLDPLDMDQCNENLALMQSSDNVTWKAKAAQGAECCSDMTTSTFLQPVIQERAWTSPIWYEPGS